MNILGYKTGEKLKVLALFIIKMEIQVHFLPLVNLYPRAESDVIFENPWILVLELLEKVWCWKYYKEHWQYLFILYLLGPSNNLKLQHNKIVKFCNAQNYFILLMRTTMWNRRKITMLENSFICVLLIMVKTIFLWPYTY